MLLCADSFFLSILFILFIINIIIFKLKTLYYKCKLYNVIGFIGY